MTQKFAEDGKVFPVTKIVAGPCLVVERKEEEKNGYNAVKIAWQKASKLNKPLSGFFKGVSKKDQGFKHLKEFRLKADDPVFEKVQKGQTISVDIFEKGDKVKVQGTSKGRGFQGVVKRHGFHGSPASHGHKDQLRMPGSAGATGPARVFKGKKMPGQMGNKSATQLNLEVIEVVPEKNEIFVKGAVPGAKDGLLIVSGQGDFEPKQAEKKEEKKEKVEEKGKKQEKKSAQEETAKKTENKEEIQKREVKENENNEKEPEKSEKNKQEKK